MKAISKAVVIEAPAQVVWETLTRPPHMSRWMTDEPLEIQSDMQVGSPIVMLGNFHGIPFENRGTILKNEPGKSFAYNYISNISRLPDVPGNYAVVEFVLTPLGTDSTVLTIIQDRCATESIYRHADFYWSVTKHMIKKMAEEPAAIEATTRF